MRTKGATEVKPKMLALLEEVAAGEQIEITKQGRVVARLVPARGPHALRGQFSEVARPRTTNCSPPMLAETSGDHGLVGHSCAPMVACRASSAIPSAQDECGPRRIPALRVAARLERR